MHTFPSREALTPEWGSRMSQARGHSGAGLLFTDASVVYSPGRFVSNITAAMDPAIDASETLGFLARTRAGSTGSSRCWRSCPGRAPRAVRPRNR